MRGSRKRYWGDLRGPWSTGSVHADVASETGTRQSEEIQETLLVGGDLKVAATTRPLPPPLVWGV